MVTSSRNTNNLQLSFFSLSHLSNMHNKELLDPYNLVNQVEKLIRFDDVEGTYHIIISNPKTILENHEDDIIPIPQTNIQKFLYWFNNLLLYIAIIIIFTILVIVFIHKCIHPIKVSKKHWPRVKYNKDILKVKIQTQQLKHKLNDTQSVSDKIIMQERSPFQHSCLDVNHIKQLQQEAENEISKFHFL